MILSTCPTGLLVGPHGNSPVSELEFKLSQALLTKTHDFSRFPLSLTATSCAVIDPATTLPASQGALHEGDDAADSMN